MRLLEGTVFDRPPRCETCGELEETCKCPPFSKTVVPPQKQTAKLSVEKRQKGKWMTIVRGLSPEHNDLPQLVTKLKTACGAGGTLRDDEIEIQGQQKDRVRAELEKIGYKTKG